MECARYIESICQYEGRPSTVIQEKLETEFLPRVTKTLLNVRSLNKTDVSMLLDNFGNFQNICTASMQQLALCPGFGEKKVKRLHQIMNFPLNSKPKKQKTQAKGDGIDNPIEATNEVTRNSLASYYAKK
jgi:DNA excision repair protein ERCC-1